MTIPIHIDPALTERIDTLAALRNESAQALVHAALAEFVDREEWQASFMSDAQASWEHYQATGLHITLDELTVWMNDWGNDRPMPECHT